MKREKLINLFDNEIIQTLVVMFVTLVIGALGLGILYLIFKQSVPLAIAFMTVVGLIIMFTLIYKLVKFNNKQTKKENEKDV